MWFSEPVRALAALLTLSVHGLTLVQAAFCTAAVVFVYVGVICLLSLSRQRHVPLSWWIYTAGAIAVAFSAYFHRTASRATRWWRSRCSSASRGRGALGHQVRAARGVRKRPGRAHGRLPHRRRPSPDAAALPLTRRAAPLVCRRKRRPQTKKGTRARHLVERDLDAPRRRPRLVSPPAPLLGEVPVEVVHRRPPFGQHDAPGVERVGGHDVLEAALLLARGTHRLDARLDEPIPLGGVEGGALAQSLRSCATYRRRGVPVHFGN